MAIRRSIVRNNAVGYRPAPAPEHRKPGRPKRYGEKVPLKRLFDDPDAMQTLGSPVYGESGVQLGVWTRDQYLHRKPFEYRDAVRRKLAACHRFIQLGLIAQGIMLAPATTVPQLVWASFGSWLRTIRPGDLQSQRWHCPPRDADGDVVEGLAAAAVDLKRLPR